MEELDLKELLSLFWSKIFQIIVIVLITTGVGIIYTYGFTTPKYSSSTTLVLTGSEKTAGTDSANSITTTDVTLNSKLISTYREIATSDKVVRKVINNLGLDISEQSLKNGITVKVVSDSEVIKISVTNEEPETASKIANELATVFSEQVKEIYNIDNVHVVDMAEKPSEPSNINHAKDVMIFVLIGVVISVIYVLLDNMLDTTIKTTEDIEKTCGVTVLASIPFDNSDNKKGGRK